MDTKIVFNTDENAGSLYIMKVFSAKPALIWNHFTQSNLLEKWWAPKPWKCETLEMNFTPDGIWKYNLISPEGEKHFGVLKYHEINLHRSFDFTEYFTDDKGEKIEEVPSGNWLVGVTGVEEGTKLTINIQYNSTEELQTILDMEFENGFTEVLNQLEELLHKKD